MRTLLGQLSAVLLCLLSAPACHELAGVDSTNYLIEERGALEHYHVANVYTNHLGPLIAFIPATGTQKIALVKSVPNANNRRALHRIVNDTPPWRDLSGLRDSLWDVVYALTEAVPKDRPRWIIGNLPVIIGIGDEQVNRDDSQFYGTLLHGRPEGSATLGIGQKLVTEAAMTKTVSRLIVLDEWPNFHVDMDTKLPPSRIIDLKQPMTIREVIEQKAWVRSP